MTEIEARREAKAAAPVADAGVATAECRVRTYVERENMYIKKMERRKPVYSREKLLGSFSELGVLSTTAMTGEKKT